MTITQSSTRFVALAAGVSVVVALTVGVFATAAPARAAALSQTQIQAIVSLLQSFGADASTIANVQASLNGQPTSGGSGGSSSGGACPSLGTVSLQQGSNSAAVKALQVFLNGSVTTQVSSSGAGSPGSETTYFGPATKAAVIKFQAANNVSPIGIVGPATRAAIAAVCGGSTGTPGVPVSGNGLKVVLSPDSPNNVALVQGQAAGALGKFTFVNPTNSNITVTNVAFKRIGVSNDTTLTNVYLYNGAVRLTDSAGVTNSAFSFNNPGGLFVVPANSTYTVSVLSDIAGGTSGQQVGVQLVSVASSGTLDTGTVFPINGFTQTISAATLASVSFSTGVTPTTANIDPQGDLTVWQDTVNVNTRAVWLKGFALREIGSILPGDVNNFRLYVDGVQVGSAVATMDNNNMVTFDLGANPVNLNTGGRVIKVLANVVGGSSRNFSYSLRYAGDALMVDSNLGQPVSATSNGSATAFTAVTAGVQTINSVAGGNGPTVNKAAASPTSNVAVGASNVKWATFNIVANGEPVKIDNLNVTVNSSVSNGGLSNGAVFFNGVQIGSTKNLAEGDTNFTFGSSMIVPTGSNSTIDIYADAKTSTTTNLVSGETVQISLNNNATNNGQGQVSLNSVTVPASVVSGNTITVSSSALTGSKASGYGNQTIIAGATAAKIGSLTLSTGSTEGVNVNTIDVGFANAVSSTFSNLMLKDSSTGTQIGTTKSTVNTTNAYSVNIALPSSGTKTIDVYADVKTGANAGPVNALLKFDTTGTGATTGNSVQVAASSAGDVTLQTMTVAGSGTLSGSVAAGNPVNANVIAGSSAVKVGQFTFSAQNSPFTIQNLMVEIPSGAATSVSDVVIKYKDQSGAQQSSTQALALPSSGQAYATSTFQGLTAYVPSNDSTDIEVWVDTPTVANGATSGVGVSAVIDASAMGFKAIDAAGNQVTTFNSGTALNSAATSGYGTQYLKKSFPTFAKNTSGLSQTVASGQPIYKFTLTADSNGAIDWNQITFNISTSSGVTVAGLVLYDVTGGGNTAITAATPISAGVAKMIVNGTGIQQVGAGTTKTYQLVPTTVAGWTSGASITVAPAVDSTAVVNNNVAGLSAQNTIWSDRSASNHTSQGTSATDWTNGYLLKDLTSTATYSCQISTNTTCN